MRSARDAPPQTNSPNDTVLCISLARHLQRKQCGEKFQAGFETKWLFPNCLGATDGKHIYIQPPANSGSTYHNSRFVCQDKVKIFCCAHGTAADANYNFIYANVVIQERLSDGGVFGQSDLQAGMDRGLLNVPPPEPLPGSNIP
ncbi:Protein ANTAGONIST OF LIKE HETEROCHROMATIN PROTEIN 1 [Labeo rohita]|uniref:Protein ANTAGONIST OF LIKE HETEROCHROMATIN PROTEIN 1 n=1 Tax=Labeo rohita TaxID=84645 RepID=A0ABQ8LWN3_LABRO|nr:Protein ANTAGONIST OF LIKE HETEROCHROMATIN PROTEIN 1 [Labeo rohita]